MPPPSHIQETALRLIRHAVQPRGEVRRVPTMGGRHPELRLRMDGERRPNAQLELSEWGTKRRARTGTTTVWMLQNAALSLIQKLRDADESFVDIRRGHVRLSTPGVLIERERLRLPRTTETSRGLRDAFGDRASLVSRVLVEHPDRIWSVRLLAASAGVSTMTASHVIRQLREHGIVEVSEEGTSHQIVLRDVESLVTRWTQRYDWRENDQLAVDAPVGSPERFLHRLPNLLKSRRWAITLQAGASLIAPHAAWDIVHIYVQLEPGERLPDVAAQHGWSAGEGGLVLLAPYYEHSVWYGERSVRGVRVVSDLQLVLDLWNYPVRGREQAEYLLDRMRRATTSRVRAAPSR